MGVIIIELNNIDKEAFRSRVETNIQEWGYLTNNKYEPIKFSKEILYLIKTRRPLRVFLCMDDENNEEWAYKIAKHCIGLGLVSPSEICMTTLEDCYLNVRSFGDMKEKYNQIFSPKNKLLIITEVREKLATDVTDCYVAFWKKLEVYCKSNPDLMVIFCSLNSDITNSLLRQKEKHSLNETVYTPWYTETLKDNYFFVVSISIKDTIKKIFEIKTIQKKEEKENGKTK